MWFCVSAHCAPFCFCGHVGLLQLSRWFRFGSAGQSTALHVFSIPRCVFELVLGQVGDDLMALGWLGGGSGGGSGMVWGWCWGWCWSGSWFCGWFGDSLGNGLGTVLGTVWAWSGFGCGMVSLHGFGDGLWIVSGTVWGVGLRWFECSGYRVGIVLSFGDACGLVFFWIPHGLGLGLVCFWFCSMCLGRFWGRCVCWLFECGGGILCTKPQSPRTPQSFARSPRAIHFHAPHFMAISGCLML